MTRLYKMSSTKPDVDNMTDAELQDAMRRKGIDVMPITASTRQLYKKLLLNESNTSQPVSEEQEEQSPINNESKQDRETSTATEIYSIFIPPIYRLESEHNANNFVFESKKDCLMETRKCKGARFKSFQNRTEALRFATYGPAPTVKLTKSTTVGSTLKEERVSLYPTPTPQQYIQFRKVIEKSDLILFNELVSKNPRYLVSKADTPSILKEGPRYNAIHICCIYNIPKICSQLLETISSADFFKLIYPDDTDDCAMRRASHLLDLYLNTPDKGFNRTALHYTSTFGFVECMKVLVSYPNCAKNSVDKYNSTAKQLILSRCKEKCPNARAEIEVLLGDHYYVPIFHDEEKLFKSKIAEPMSPNVPLSPPKPNQQLNESLGYTFNPSYKLHGYAGPMGPHQAKSFYSKWRSPVTSSPKTQGKRPADDLNLEIIGRDLAYDLKVPWKEYWSFLDEFIDISSTEGFEKLEARLKKMMSQVMIERNEQLDVFLLSSDKLEYAENDGVDVCDKRQSETSTPSTIGALCNEFFDLTLNSSSNSDEEGVSKSKSPCNCYEESESPIQTINNNNIHSDGRTDAFDYKEYVFKSAAVSAASISLILCAGSDSIYQFDFAAFETVRRDVCFELETLRDILGRLTVERRVDFSFVHATLASAIVEKISNSANSCESRCKIFDKLAELSRDDAKEQIIFGHFNCLCTILAEMTACGRNGASDLPTSNCACVWSNESVKAVEFPKNLKYPKAHNFIKRLFKDEEQPPDENSVIRQLNFSEDEIKFSPSNEDGESFVTAGSSICDSMRTPVETIPFYIYGQNPSRDDNLVLSAIQKKEIGSEQYPFISQWFYNVSTYTSHQRDCWPSMDAKQMENDIPSPSQFTNVISSTPKLLRKQFYSHFNSPS